MGSVYLAIALEGASEDRARKAEAVEALRNLRGELEQDRAELAEIVAAQRDRVERHQRIERWLSVSEAPQADSLAADFYALFSVNRTMFPRTSAWTTMVASGQLTDLDDAGLVSRLASFYENRSARLVYNGALYDDWVSKVALSDLPAAWNRIEGRLAVPPGPDRDRFRSQLLVLNDLGSNFLGLLDEWGAELDTVLADVDRYLGRGG